MTHGQPYFYVVAAPCDRPGEEAVECLAQWMKVSPYDARQKLTATLPQILVAMPNRADAVEMQIALDAAGVATRCLSHYQIVHSPAIFHVVSCELADDRVTFVCKDSARVHVAPGEAKAMVKARVRRRKETHRTGRTAAGLLTHHHGEDRRGATATFVLNLYVAGPRTLRIAQETFDYSCLGPHKTLSSLDNFGILVGLMRDLFPEAILDDALCRAATDFEKVDDSYRLARPLPGSSIHERSRTLTDESFVHEAAWLIALTRTDGDW